MNEIKTNNEESQYDEKKFCRNCGQLYPINANAVLCSCGNTILASNDYQSVDDGWGENNELIDTHA